MPRLRGFRYGSWAEWILINVFEDQPSIIAIDTETTGLGFYDMPFAATLTWRDRDGDLKSGYIDLEDPDGLEWRIDVLRQILDGVDAWVFHNAKFDLAKLLLIGATTRERIEEITLHDTQTQYMLLDENSTKRLKDLAVRVLGYEDTIAVPYKSGPKAKAGETRLVPKEEYRLGEARRKLGLRKEDGYHLLPREVLIPYALRDTEFTLQLHEVLYPRLEAKNDPDLITLYEDAMKLKRVLLRMEADGLALDMPYLEKTASDYGVRVMEKWDRVTELVGDPDFNPRSPAQVSAAFARRGIELPDTQEKTLATLDDELAQSLLEYRKDFKLHTVYLRGLLREQRGGVVNPNFNDDGARTGRMSSSAAKE